MKRIFTALFYFISIFLFGQNDFGDYLDGLDREGASSLAELAGELMKPNYKESLESNRSLLEAYIEEAQIWTDLSEEDIKAWKASIQYLMDIGYEMNEFKKDRAEPIFYLTSSMWTELSSENGDNQYKLNTSLFELGAQSDIVIDGGSYFEWILRDESLDSPMLQDYFDDFSTWPESRRQDWLFNLFGSTDPENLSSSIDEMIKQNLFDVNMRSKNGKRNLFNVSVEAENLEYAKKLLENGFDINKRCFDCNGETALHGVVTAEPWGEDEMYELILSMLAKGGNPDLRDMEGLTPIHWAIKLNNEQAFTAFMQDEVSFVKNMVTIKKGLNYLEYFKKNWSEDQEDDTMILLMNKTGLEHPPTKEDEKMAKEESKAAKKDEKEAKKDKKKEKKKKNN